MRRTARPRVRRSRGCSSLRSVTTWAASDALCAGLQINNHLQDCAKDYKNLNRVYLPRDALAASGATVEMLGEAKSQPALLQCLQALAVRTETLLNESKSLSAEVRDFRLGLEIAVIQAFADKIVGMLKVRDPLSERVHLSKPELLAQIEQDEKTATATLASRTARPATSAPTRITTSEPKSGTTRGFATSAMSVTAIAVTIPRRWRERSK